MQIIGLFYTKFKRNGLKLLLELAPGSRTWLVIELADLKSINNRRRVTMVRRSSCMGGHLAEL